MEGESTSIHPSVISRSFSYSSHSGRLSPRRAALCKGDVTREGSNKRKAQSERARDRPTGLGSDGRVAIVGAEKI